MLFGYHPEILLGGWVRASLSSQYIQELCWKVLPFFFAFLVSGFIWWPSQLRSLPWLVLYLRSPELAALAAQVFRSWGCFTWSWSWSLIPLVSPLTHHLRDPFVCLLAQEYSSSWVVAPFCIFLSLEAGYVVFKDQEMKKNFASCKRSNYISKL